MGLFFNRIENINISIHCTEGTSKFLPPILTILLNPSNHLLNNINQLQILILQFGEPPVDDFITLFSDDGHQLSGEEGFWFGHLGVDGVCFLQGFGEFEDVVYAFA